MLVLPSIYCALILMVVKTFSVWVLGTRLSQLSGKKDPTFYFFKCDRQTITLKKVY